MNDITVPEFSQLVDLRTEVDAELMEASIRLKRLGLPSGRIFGAVVPASGPGAQRLRMELSERTRVLAERQTALNVQIKKHVHPDVRLISTPH